jgi:P-type E1-E2 ATPase
MKIDIPNYGVLEIKNLVFDINGTLAENGKLLDGVEEGINSLAEDLNIYIVTADTFGTASDIIKNINAELVLDEDNQGAAFKGEYVEKLGSDKTAAVGNGNNDLEMIKKAELGIAVLGPEGTSPQTMQNADIIIKDIKDLFKILSNPTKLKATLRK